MRDGAPLLHDDLVTDSLGKPAGKPSNVAKHFQFKLGDVAAGFAKASVVVEREFHTAPSTRATSSRTTPRRCGTPTAA